MVRHPSLHISKGLSLPVASVTQTFAILAKAGGGQNVYVTGPLPDGMNAGILSALLVMCQQCKTVVRQQETAPAIPMPLRFFYVALRACVATLFETFLSGGSILGNRNREVV